MSAFAVGHYSFSGSNGFGDGVRFSCSMTAAVASCLFQKWLLICADCFDGCQIILWWKLHGLRSGS